jgi:hypothetical protein
MQNHGSVRTLCPECVFSLSGACKQSGPSRGEMLTDRLSHCLISFQVTAHWATVASRRIARKLHTSRKKRSAGLQQLRTLNMATFTCYNLCKNRQFQGSGPVPCSVPVKTFFGESIFPLLFQHPFFLRNINQSTCSSNLILRSETLFVTLLKIICYA